VLELDFRAVKLCSLNSNIKTSEKVANEWTYEMSDRKQVNDTVQTNKNDK
jgi:hypothetical protein